MLKIYSDYNKIDKKLWNDFVSSHPSGNIFQTPIIFDFYLKVSTYTPFVFALENEKGDLQGILLSVLQKEKNKIKAKFSSRLIIYGGPLVRDGNPEYALKLLNEMNRQTKAKAIYVEFRNLFNTNIIKTSFLSCGYRFKEHLNYIVPLTSEEENKKKLSKSKLRQIKSTLNSGVSIKVGESEEEVIQLYQILKNLYKEKVKKPLPPIDFFIEFFKNTELGRILIIEKDKKVVGGIVCPIYKNQTIYEYFVCGLDGQIKNTFPSIVATWAAIEYGVKNQLKFFDFLGAGSPDSDYGVREFKAKFGGDLVSYGRYIRINNILLYNLGKIGLKILGLINKA